ncbi:hypothetical protein J6590_071601 [Homalodisca vitripennis]|nr:hypothetical protein J6590_071601 [Homalodisca vitripennis]
MMTRAQRLVALGVALAKKAEEQSQSTSDSNKYDINSVIVFCRIEESLLDDA